MRAVVHDEPIIACLHKRAIISTFLLKRILTFDSEICRCENIALTRGDSILICPSS